MWIELSKILPYLIYPLSLFLGSQVCAAIFYKIGAKRSAIFTFTLGYLIFLISASPMTAIFLNKKLESWYIPVLAQNAPEADVAILLGGGLSIPLKPRLTAELSDGSDRVLYAARLYKQGKVKNIIVTGGNVFKQQENVKAESWYISELLQEWGVHKSAILTEGDSRNTRENALETKKIMQQYNFKTSLLVTSAFHMPRASSTFRAVGIEITPLPVDFHIVGVSQPHLLSLLPSSGALQATTHALREYLGIFVYGLRGWLEPAQ